MILIITVGLLVITPTEAFAGMTTDEVRKFEASMLKAEKGDSAAQSNIGVCYQKGLGVAKDEAQAVVWYRKAAEQGQAVAQSNLGMCYEYGLGVTKDLIQALTWYRKAADQGDTTAQTNLGSLYATGVGVLKDEAQAAILFQKAAEQGAKEAQLNLGVCYEYGRGVVKDARMAFYWYLKSAKQGNANAQLNLGVCYYTGSGTAKNAIEAYAYFNLAGVSNPSARENLSIIERRLSREDISAGQKRTMELQGEIERSEQTDTSSKKASREEELIDLYTHAYGCSSKLSLSDLRQIARFEKLQADWNSALIPLVKGLRDPNMAPEDWARTAHLYLNEAEKIKVRMAIAAAQVEERNAKSILNQISGLNNQIFSAWMDIRQAISSGDNEAYRRAGALSQSLAQDKANVAGPVLRRLSEKLGDKAVEGAVEREMRDLAEKLGM